MNPSWLTGKMPEAMYRHEHPRHIEEAKAETQRMLEEELEKLTRQAEEENSND